MSWPISLSWRIEIKRRKPCGSESEEVSDDEEALMSLMAFKDNQNGDIDSIEVNEYNPLYDELLDAFKELHGYMDSYVKE